MANRLKPLMSRTRVVLLVVLAMAALLGFWITGPTQPLEGQDMTSHRAPTPPDGVPVDAVFRGGADGGYFVTLTETPLVLADGRQLAGYRMGIYHSFAGDIEYDGVGLYIPPREVSPDGTVQFMPAPSVADILGSAFYSAGALEFPVPGSASPGRIVPMPLE